MPYVGWFTVSSVPSYHREPPGETPAPKPNMLRRAAWPSNAEKLMYCRSVALSDAVACASVSPRTPRSEEHTSELQSRLHLVCRLLLEKKKKKKIDVHYEMRPK